MKKEEDQHQVEELMSNEEVTFSADNRKLSSAKYRIYKNVIVVAFSYLLQFSATNGLNSLQSSLNSHENLGVYSLLTMSVSFLISCLFVPMFLCRLIGYKWSLVLSQHVALFFIVSNYFPSFYTLLPASVLYGAALSVLWTLQGSFIVHMSNEYGVVCAERQLHHEKIMFKFFGIFMIIFQLNQIMGNAVSAVMLNKEILKNVIPHHHHHHHHPETSTATSILNESAVIWENTIASMNKSTTEAMARMCGTRDCSGPASEISRPNDDQVFWLCASFVGITAMGILALIVLMDDIRPSKEDLGSISSIVKDTFKMFADKKLWTLLPIVAFVASLNTFIMVDFTKSFISCMFGIDKIGHSFIVCGITSSLFSFLVSQLTKIVNKILILVTALAMTMLVMVYFNLGEHTFTYTIIVYLLPLIFGIMEGAWGTVINTLIGSAFLDKQLVAFSNNRFCMSFFFFVTYSYSSVLCVYQKTYVVFGLAGLSILSTILLEIILQKEHKKKHHHRHHNR